MPVEMANDRSRSSQTTTLPAVLVGLSSSTSSSANSTSSSQHQLQLAAHACDQCSKCFGNAKLLAQHQHMFHTEKAFVCEICQKAFRFRSNLAEHRSVHTALKPYVCKFCGKSSRLKGNLTKHILKHHKKEQNAYIGKDDIIIKKGKKSVKDPAAVDFLEKSMIVLTGAGESPQNPLAHLYPGMKDDEDEDEDDDMLVDEHHRLPAQRSFLLPLGLGNGSVDLRLHSPDTSEGDKSDDRGVVGTTLLLNGSVDDGGNALLHDDDDMAVSSSNASPVLLATPPATNPVSNTNANTATILHLHGNNNNHHHHRPTGTGAGRGGTVTTTGAIVPSRTQCPACGKHFRKGSSLQVHMTLNHGLPPPGSVSSSGGGDDQVEEKSSECGGSSADTLSREIREMRDMLAELRTATTRQDQQPRVEQLLTGLDARVGRLEKQLDMALSSIYTLVQLQNGINTAVTRFREDICEQLKSLRAAIISTPAGGHHH